MVGKIFLETFERHVIFVKMIDLSLCNWYEFQE